MLWLTALAVSVIGSTDPNTSPPPVPTPAPGPVAKRGLLDRETVRYYIRLQQPAVRHCYVLELGRRPELRTRVTLELSIDGTGRVTRCSFGSTDLDRCVARAVCSIRFPYVYDWMVGGQTRVSLGTTDVRYSFRFQPRDRKNKRRGGASREPASREASRAPRAPEATPKKRVQRPRPARPAPLLRPSPVPAPPPKLPRIPRIKPPRGKDPLEGLDLDNPL